MGSKLVRTGERPAEPSTLPRGIGPLNLSYFCLIVADLGSIGGLLGQFSVGNSDAAILAPVLGMFLGIVYACFPLQFLDGRSMLALAAYRLLLWCLLIFHIPLILVLVADFWLHWDQASGLLFLTAPISMVATPCIYPIAAALRSMRWLDPKAGPEDWEPMIGIDGQGPPDPSKPKPETTALWLAFTLPFFAAYRARHKALGVVALLLWVGTIYFLVASPLRAIITFTVAAGIGVRLSISASREAALAGKNFAKGERERLLRGIFRPERLRPPPGFVASGLLCLPLVFILDYIASAIFFALQTAGGMQPFLATIENFCFALILILPFLFVPLMLFLPFGTRPGIFTYRVLALIIFGGEICLAALYAAISLHVSFFGKIIFVPDAVYPILWPVTLSLLAGIPFALIISLSIVNVGKMTNIMRA